MINSKADNQNAWFIAGLIIMSTAWSSAAVADFRGRSGASSDRANNPAFSTHQLMSMRSNRGGSRLSRSVYQTRSAMGARYSLNNYSSNYRYVSGRNNSFRNDNYYNSRYSNSGFYFAGGLLLGAWLGSYNRYDSYYYGGYPSTRNYGRYNSRYFDYGFSTNSVRYYQSAPVQPRIIYREKIVSDVTARDDKQTHLLKDLAGNCFEVSYSAGGQELRLEVPLEKCSW